MGILFPELVSILTYPTGMGWSDECSVPKGAMAICSVLVGISLSLVAVSLVMNERCEPSSNRMLPWICNPFALMGAIAVFNRLMVVAVELCLVEQDPYNTGVVGFGCAGGGFISVLGVFCVGASPLIGLHRLVWCLWLQRLQ